MAPEQFSELPPTLAARVDSDATSVPHPFPTSVPEAREAAARRLLALTPIALDTLGFAMSAGSMKERVMASQEILKRSPATRDEITIVSPTLPASFAGAFLATLQSFASFLPQSTKSAPDQSLSEGAPDALEVLATPVEPAAASPLPNDDLERA